MAVIEVIKNQIQLAKNNLSESLNFLGFKIIDKFGDHLPGSGWLVIRKNMAATAHSDLDEISVNSHITGDIYISLV